MNFKILFIIITKVHCNLFLSFCFLKETVIFSVTKTKL